ncbi:pyrroloquinoline quinone biosynthesis peptide chaperone PqqD [Swingsia samuiensis]|uniref:Pyrroloquinoline quinone biosynthesis peptide chaperone PqqD n=1 Tax=Swingsia samuiensis TaxID=1293412 RepID=A0A4Y6UK63_9PROT|nr:pyrroloquinoline quinone biosynthesis peptide chaperone PqqD [Swingsia samuiensis]QDH16866.1 pyrroloquinoline quinone biosynthesis peptide chaperone PqqD [Swingsia samuiensis]
MSLSSKSILKFKRGHRLQHDRVRDIWLIQAPEKAFIVEGAAPHILHLIDGERDIESIVKKLSEDFSAPSDVISRDVYALLSDLAEKGVLYA